MADQTFTFSTSGLGETIKQVNTLAKAQADLEKFIRTTAKAFEAQGQSQQAAIASANNLIKANNITAKSFLDLATAQAQTGKQAQQQAKTQLSLEAAYKASEQSIQSINRAFGDNSARALEATRSYLALQKAGASSSDTFRVLSSTLGTTQAQFNAIESNISKSTKGFGLLKNAVTGIGQGIGQDIFGSIKAILTDLPTRIVNVTRDFEGLKTALDFSQGGKEAGSEALTFIRSEVDRLKIPLNGAVENFTKLSAATKGTVAEGGKTEKVFSNIATAARVLNVSADDTNGIFRAVIQSFSKGKVQAEELRGQIGDRLPGAVQIFARAIGVSTEELDKLLQDGKVGIPELIKFTDQLGKEFAAGVPEAVRTANAAFTDFNNKLQEIVIAFGSEVLPILTEFLQGINANSNGLKNFAKNAGENVAVILKTIGGGLKFVSDNSQILIPLLQALTLQFAAIQAISIVGTLQGTTAGLIASGLAAGKFSAALAVATTQTKLFLASLAPIAPILIAIAGAVVAGNFLKYAADVGAANKALEDLFITSDALSGGALSLANQTKNLNAELSKSKTISASQTREAQLLVNTNKQVIKSLRERLEAAKAENVVTDEQKNAQQVLIAQLNSSIGALSGQNNALLENIDRIKAGSAARKKSKEDIKSETDALKEQTERLKEAAKAEFDRQELTAKRSQEDQERTIQKTETKQIKTLETTKDTTVADTREQQEKNIALLQQQNQQKLNDLEKAFEQNTLQPLRENQQRKLNEIQQTFEDGQNRKKEDLQRKLNDQQSRFDEQQNQRKQAFDNQQNAALRGVDRQLQLEGAQSSDERKKLEEQFANEDKLAARRAELEAPIRAAQKAFEEQLKQEQLTFETTVLAPQKKALEAELQAEKLNFETNTLAPLKKQQELELTNAKAEFEKTVLQPQKIALENQLNEQRKANQIALNQIQQQFEEQINALKERFENARIARARKFEDDQNARKLAFEQRIQNIEKQNALALENVKDQRAQARAKLESSVQTTRPNSNKLPSRKSGGTVIAGQPYNVHPPEVFIPNVTGTILNRQQAIANIDKLMAISGKQFSNLGGNVNAGGGFETLEKEIKSLHKTIAEKPAPRINVPVTFDGGTDNGFEDYNRFMKLQRAIMRGLL